MFEAYMYMYVIEIFVVDFLLLSVFVCTSFCPEMFQMTEILIFGLRYETSIVKI